MRGFRRTAGMVAVMAGLAAATLHAQEGELRQLLSRLPSDSALVVGTADTRATLKTLRQWGEPTAKSLLEPEDAIELLATLDELAAALSEPAVAAVGKDGTWRAIARTELTQQQWSELLGRIGLRHHAEEDLVAFDDFAGLLGVEGGLLAVAPDREGVGQLLGPPEPGRKSMPDDPEAAALLGRRDVEEAAVFAFKPRGLPPGMDTTAEPGDPYEPVLARLKAVLTYSFELESPALCCLHVEERELRLTVTALWPHVAPVEGAPVLPLLPDNWPITLTGFMPDLAAAMDQIEGAMAAFDPDIAAEFREEMGELNRDLGYDFQRDLLGNLGPQWAFGLLRPEGPEKPDWVLLAGVKDEEKLVRSAEGLARLAKEPWDEKEAEEGARRFSTRAFTVPLEVAIGGNMAAIGSPEAALGAVWPLLGTPPTVAEEAAPAWEAHAVVRWPLPQTGDEEKSPVLNWLWNLPDQTRLVADVVRRPDELYAGVALLEVTAEDMARLLARVVGEQTEEMQRNQCAANLRQLAVALAMYSLDHQDQYPASLADLLQYVGVKIVFVCPSDPLPMRLGEDFNCSYRYVGALRVPADPTGVAVVFENGGNHEGGRNVLFADMRAEWLTEAEFQARLRESLRVVKQKDWDKYTPEQQKAIEAFYTGNLPP